ncbi:MAG: hypothetical protein AAF997_05735 [Myxococcota bacterium]
MIAEPPSAPDPPPVVVQERPPPLETPKPQREEPVGRLRVGGGLGLGFGSDIAFVEVAPQVSYLVKRIVEPGVAFIYQYTKDRFPIEDVVWQTYGGSIFTRIYPIPSLFFLVEGELLNAGFRQGDFTSTRSNFYNLFLGGGYGIGVGRGAFMVFALKVNVFRSDLYPSNFPIFAVGAGYSF